MVDFFFKNINIICLTNKNNNLTFNKRNKVFYVTVDDGFVR